MLIDNESYFCMQCQMIHIRQQEDLIMTTGWVHLDSIQYAVGCCNQHESKPHSQSHTSSWHRD
ncbi:hypothetical protein A8990_1695 [Paenibacillus taihuensis]|uniref:Uncharacterized protein n=1 Tax=Paenibacillus taihuensis TaxID=1156355 RepID=A0A3D9Q3V4_9BACL|nr:hypothetical protein A8990_1695 [Paenibacillus taihuensis]